MLSINSTKIQGCVNDDSVRHRRYCAIPKKDSVDGFEFHGRIVCSHCKSYSSTELSYVCPVCGTTNNLSTSKNAYNTSARYLSGLRGNLMRNGYTSTRCNDKTLNFKQSSSSTEVDIGHFAMAA